MEYNEIEALIQFLRREISAQTPIYTRNETILFMDPQAKLDLRILAEKILNYADEE